MNEHEILNQIKQIHPILEREKTTWLNPVTLSETFNIPIEMANKVANKYNFETSLMSQKKTLNI